MPSEKNITFVKKQKDNENQKKVYKNKNDLIKTDYGLKFTNINEDDKENFSKKIKKENSTFWKQKFQTIFSEKIALEKELANKTKQINQLLQKLSKIDFEEKEHLQNTNKHLNEKIKLLKMNNATEINHSTHLKKALDAAIDQIDIFEEKMDKFGKMDDESTDLKNYIFEMSILYEASKDAILDLKNKLLFSERKWRFGKNVKIGKKGNKKEHKKVPWKF
ncbi:hypothetical protein MHBO_003194 [Bonamia ostreae]|uniref:Uncharacterized protein n=1 Tax=Bonamia ostreae TaxID=126728 RepID=A0ABV2APR1_9EUKA